ncbi:MAG: hypothetical protein LBM93_03115 [Oscillospiraceae bacterium]|jgi:hypothetical protein|nr:hypothetical protein [Oscillospiraceae bacterium]
MFNLEVEHPVIYEIVQFFKIILGFGIIVMLIILAVFEIKAPKTTFSEHKILSVSYMENAENTDFKIGNDGKNFFIYTEKDDNGGVALEKYKIDLTTIYKTLSETEKPYVKIKSNRYFGIKKVEIFVPENAITETFTDPTPKAEAESEKEKK